MQQSTTELVNCYLDPITNELTTCVFLLVLAVGPIVVGFGNRAVMIVTRERHLTAPINNYERERERERE